VRTTSSTACLNQFHEQNRPSSIRCLKTILLLSSMHFKRLAEMTMLSSIGLQVQHYHFTCSAMSPTPAELTHFLRDLANALFTFSGVLSHLNSFLGTADMPVIRPEECYWLCRSSKDPLGIVLRNIETTTGHARQPEISNDDTRANLLHESDVHVHTADHECFVADLGYTCSPQLRSSYQREDCSLKARDSYASLSTHF